MNNTDTASQNLPSPAAPSGLRRLAKRLAAGVVVAGAAGTAALFGVAALISPELDVSAEADLAAPPEAIGRALTSVDGVQAWWRAKHGDIASHGGGPVAGPGMVVTFAVNGKTTERWTLVTASEREIVYRASFVGLFDVDRTFTLTPTDTGTRVRWHETGTIDKMPVRLLRLLMTDAKVEARFVDALHQLGRAVAA